MSKEVTTNFASLKARRIQIITKMEAMRSDGMRYDNQELLANIEDTVVLTRTQGRRQGDRGEPVYLNLAERSAADRGLHVVDRTLHR